MQIEHSVALVTGANRGIGRAFVEELVQRGARRVYAATRDVDTLDAEARLDRDRVRPLQLDVRDPSAAHTAAAQAHDVTQSLRADLGKRGVAVHAVFPGAVDTDMLRDIDMPKPTLLDVARATLSAVEAGEADIFPDPMSRQVYSSWRDDHKVVERLFATM